MEFWSTISGLMRRPMVIIPTVLVALAAGILAYKSTPATYTSSTTMVLTPTEYGSSQSLDPSKPTELTNPMMNFNGSLQTTSAILIESMGTKEVRQQLGETEMGARLVINDGRTNPELLGLNGPFIYIEGRSQSAADAQRLVTDAQQLMKTKLEEWQGALKAPQKTYVNLVDVVSPTSPVPSTGQATKLGMLAFLFGFMLCLGSGYALHQLGARRRASAAASPPKLVEEPATPGGTREPARGPSRGRPYVPIPEDADDVELEPVSVPTPLRTPASRVVAVDAEQTTRTPPKKIARFKER